VCARRNRPPPILSPIRKLAVAVTDNGLLAPELAAGIARVKSAESIGVGPALLNGQGLRAHAITAELLARAPRRSATRRTRRRKYNFSQTCRAVARK
jgi:hypothetical protein